MIKRPQNITKDNKEFLVVTLRCCEVCAGGINDRCGSIGGVPCDETLVCARPLEKPGPRQGTSMDDYNKYEIMPENWSSWGTCQRK